MSKKPLTIFTMSIVLLCMAFCGMLASAVTAAGEDDELDPVPITAGYAPLSDRIVDYRISVEFDPQRRTLDCEQTVRWRNPGMKPVSELYFHTYPNAFESDASTFMREQRTINGETPSVRGGMNISSIRLPNGAQLRGNSRFVQPDDGNPDDRTLLRLDLPAPVQPGETISLDVSFTVDLPDVYRRMGVAGDFVMAGQWFPKLAVYETAGMRGRLEEGWNVHQYHANSEFYADFGNFDVTVRVPRDYQVAAAGSLRQAYTAEKTKVYRFFAQDIHDFAWAASSAFQLHTVTFSPSPGGSEIKLKLYTDSRSEAYRDRYVKAALKALKRYAEWFGAYPYSTVTIVVPPAEASRAGSMEYPTFLMAKAVPLESEPDLTLERTVMHEMAHQYFYGMVANNEFEEAWLDEAFAVYAEDRAMIEDYGQGRSRLPVSRFRKVALDSWLYQSRLDYEDNVYFRGKMALDGIAFRIGEDRMNTVLKTYFERFQFHHPGTADFENVLEEVTGMTWSPFFRETIYGEDPIQTPVLAAEMPVESPEDAISNANNELDSVEAGGGDETDAVAHNVCYDTV